MYKSGKGIYIQVKRRKGWSTSKSDSTKQHTPSTNRHSHQTCRHSNARATTSTLRLDLVPLHHRLPRWRNNTHAPTTIRRRPWLRSTASDSRTTDRNRHGIPHPIPIHIIHIKRMAPRPISPAPNTRIQPPVPRTRRLPARHAARAERTFLIEPADVRVGIVHCPYRRALGDFPGNTRATLPPTPPESIAPIAAR